MQAQREAHVRSDNDTQAVLQYLWDRTGNWDGRARRFARSSWSLPLPRSFNEYDRDGGLEGRVGESAPSLACIRVFKSVVCNRIKEVTEREHT